MTPSEELAHHFLDAIREAVENSVDVDWSPQKAAIYVLRLLSEASQ